MKDKKILNKLKAASMIFMVILLFLIIFLWIRNDNMSYLVYDSRKIADNVMFVVKLLLVLFIMYKSARDRKYFISILVFVQTAGVFWVRFMGSEVTDSEYMKIDRLSITMCTIIVLGTIFIGLYDYAKDNINNLWMYVASIGFLGVVLSYDLMWMDFFLAVAFIGLYMWIQDGRYTILGAGILAEILVTAACIFASEKIQVLSLQSVIVCKAMNVKGAVYPAVLMLAALFILLLCGIWIFIKKEADTSIKLYLTAISVTASGIYLLIRFVPVFNGDLTGTVVKFAGALVLLLMSVYLNMVKQWKSAVMVLSMVCQAGLMALFGAGIPLTTWYGIMMLLIYIPLITILYVNEDSGKYLYAHISSILCFIFTPLQMVCFRMSAFKLYLKVENKVWIAIMAISYVILIAGVVRWMNKTVKDVNKSEKSRKSVLWVSFIVLAAVIIIMPFIVKNWIYPMMSQTEIMISNITASKIPVREYIVTAVMVVITFLVPLLVSIISKLKRREDWLK